MPLRLKIESATWNFTVLSCDDYQVRVSADECGNLDKICDFTAKEGLGQ